jgi:hypothetical protein
VYARECCDQYSLTGAAEPLALEGRFAQIRRGTKEGTEWEGI